MATFLRMLLVALALAIAIAIGGATATRFVRLGRAHPHERIMFTVGVKQQNVEVLTKEAQQRSDPKSPLYGKFLTPTGVCDIVRPQQVHLDIVHRWLESSNFSSTTTVRWYCDAVRVTTDVASVETLLAIKMHAYADTRNNGRRVIQTTDSLSIPGIVIEAIRGVFGLLEFHFPVRAQQQVGLACNTCGSPSFPNCVYDQSGDELPICCASNTWGCVSPTASYFVHCCNVGEQCQGGTCIPTWSATQDPYAATFITPAILRKLYNVPEEEIQQNENTAMGVVAFNGDHFSWSDYQYFKALSGDRANNIWVHCPDGTEGYHDQVTCLDDCPECDEEESNLDTQYMSTTGNGVFMWFWSNPMGAEVLEWAQDVLLDYLFTEKPLPLTWSISYGEVEIGACNNESVVDQPTCLAIVANYFLQANIELSKLAAIGMSVFVSSGDSGAIGEKQSVLLTMLVPEFPASSPWVTAVGATQLTNQPSPQCVPSNECVGERVASIATLSVITSGGGFSLYFPMPSYQVAAVSKYLSLPAQMLPNQLYYPENRGYPDVAALGHYIAIVLNATIISVDGTSASSPIVAGMFARLNQELIQAGGHAIGLPNLLLYQMFADFPDAFTDIILGDNSCGEQCSSHCTPESTDFCLYDEGSKGYTASDGWDATTGLGSLNYNKLVEYAFELQNLALSGGGTKSSSASSSSAGASGTAAAGLALAVITLLAVLALAVYVLRDKIAAWRRQPRAASNLGGVPSSTSHA